METKGRKAIVHTLWLTNRSNGDFRCGYISFGRGQWSAGQALRQWHNLWKLPTEAFGAPQDLIEMLKQL